MIPLSNGNNVAVGSVRSSSPCGSTSTAATTTADNSPKQLPPLQTKEQGKEISSELCNLNENTWFSIGKIS